MNNQTISKRAALFAVCGLATAGLLTAQAQDTDAQGAPGSQQQRQSGQASGQTSIGLTGQRSMGQTQKINKASELIGLTVKNAQGEELGEIKDIVIDFSSDKVGYVVLSSDPGAFSAERLHAVPLRAFQPGADGESLTLNADKQKMASAEGFTKENWPSPTSPAFGAQPFWQESPGSQHQQRDQRDQQRDYLPGSGTRGNQGTSPGTTPSTPGSTPGTTPR